MLLLVENAGHVLSKERMLEEIWEGSFVEENNLAQNISLLRKTLGENDGVKFIETVSKRGYRFVAPVEASIDGADGAGANFSSAKETAQEEFTPPKIRPKISYVQNGDVNIAYQVLGDGPVDIVFVMGWVSHLEYFWKEPQFASFLNRLASFSRLILFDKRGTGLPTLEQRMEDVHAVMDAVGSERAVLIGVSEGGPMCSLFAATYPEKTTALVMIGTYAKRVRSANYPWAPAPEQREAFFELMQREWGGPVGIEERAPSMAADDDFRAWWAAYLRWAQAPARRSR